MPVAIGAPSLSSYLAEHPTDNLRVTEHSGKRYWVHAPKMRTGHFSVGCTGAVIGGALVAAGVTLAILVEETQPIY